MHVERQICTNEGKAACHYGFDSILFAKKRAEVFSSALGLTVGRAGFGQWRTAWPGFRDGSEISGLGAVDGAGACEQEAACACGYGQIKDVSGAIHDLVVALQRGEAGPDGGIGSGVQHMSEGLVPRERVALLDVALEKRDQGMTDELWVRSQKKIGVAT